MKSKFQQWKEAVRNTPPEKLLKINMQGFVFQTIGIIVVCIMLIVVGRAMWWLLFAFVFSLFHTVSGFISSYQQYKEIMDIKKQFPQEFKPIRSPHLKRVQIVKEVFGKKAGWFTSILSVVISFFIYAKVWDSLLYKALFVITIPILYYIFYFIIFYKLATWRFDKNG